jgi:hypothetical protein
MNTYASAKKRLFRAFCCCREEGIPAAAVTLHGAGCGDGVLFVYRIRSIVYSPQSIVYAAAAAAVCFLYTEYIPASDY